MNRYIEGARDMREWYLAYLEVGFSRREAMRLCCRPLVLLQPTSSPGTEEFMSHASVLLNRQLAEEDE